MTHFSLAKVAGIALLGLGFAGPVLADTPPTPVAGPTAQAPAPSAPVQDQTAAHKDKSKKSSSSTTPPPK